MSPYLFKQNIKTINLFSDSERNPIFEEKLYKKQKCIVITDTLSYFDKIIVTGTFFITYDESTSKIVLRCKKLQLLRCAVHVTKFFFLQGANFSKK
jgi:hypothetical protein